MPLTLDPVSLGVPMPLTLEPASLGVPMPLTPDPASFGVPMPGTGDADSDTPTGAAPLPKKLLSLPSRVGGAAVVATGDLSGDACLAAGGALVASGDGVCLGEPGATCASGWVCERASVTEREKDVCVPVRTWVDKSER